MDISGRIWKAHALDSTPDRALQLLPFDAWIQASAALNISNELGDELFQDALFAHFVHGDLGNRVSLILEGIHKLKTETTSPFVTAQRSASLAASFGH